MTTATDVINQARRWLGTKEGPRSNQVVFNTRYYGRVVYGSAYPWCQTFAWCVAQDAGAGNITPSKTAYTPAAANWYKTRGQWRTSNPKPGDQVFYNISGLGRISHTGWVESVNGDGSFYAIEGNTNGAGSREGDGVWRKLRRNVGAGGGFGRPNYAGSSTTPPPASGQLEEDGDWGPNTMRATQEWLKRVADPSLVVDGWYQWNGQWTPDFGPNTTRAFQSRVNHLCYTGGYGTIAIDGEMGPKTIKAYQWCLGVAQDGQWPEENSETTTAHQWNLNRGGL